MVPAQRVYQPAGSWPLPGVGAIDLDADVPRSDRGAETGGREAMRSERL